MSSVVELILAKSQVGLTQPTSYYQNKISRKRITMCRKINICFINEANELTYEDFFQLNVRTTDKLILDYNPSDEYHWIYDKLQPRDDADFFITTYKDNPKLEPELVKEIERLQQADLNHWRIYGLGLRGISTETIYTHWRLCKELPMKGELIMGQDFGYNVSSALVRVDIY